MASHQNNGASSLITISHNGDYAVRVNAKELAVHTAAAVEGSRLLQSIKLKEQLASQLTFLKISDLDTTDYHDHAEDEGLLDLVPHQRLLCASDNHVSVWQINSLEWHADIENLEPAVTSVGFGARDNEVLLFHLWNSKVTIFNLDSGRSQVIKAPKFSSNPNGHGYRPRTRQFAILLKPETIDLLTIHETYTYELITRVTLPTVDAQGLKWCPDGRWIAVWEAASNGTKVVIYTADGQYLRTFTGTLGSDSTYDLGVRMVEWSPVANGESQVLAVGKCDGNVDLLNTRTFTCVSSLSHTFYIDAASPMVWRERCVDGKLEYAEASSSSAFTTARESSGQPRGVSMMRFSYNGDFLATIDQSQPNIVWIWSLTPSARLESALVHENNVRQLAWHPSGTNELLITTNNSVMAAVHLWSSNMTPVIAGVPIARNDAGRYDVTWLKSLTRDEPSSFWLSTQDDAVLGHVTLQDGRGQFNLLHSVSRANEFGSMMNGNY